jgi:NADH:ubiquinone reductase (H+-translocating)
MSSPRPKIVIVGAGFGGLFAAQALAKVDTDVTIIDRHNYHLFQPLLYQVATAGLPPSDIAWPIRSILRRQRNARVLLAEVEGIDVRKRVVVLHDRTIPFDYLVVATGSTHSYFGHEQWRAIAPGLKSIDDATLIRRRVLKAFEAAEMEDDPAKRERLLRFVIVGAGPTGVELAGTIAELAHRTLLADFRRIDPGAAKVILIEAGPRVLAAFREPQSAYAHRALERLGVEVRVSSAVTECDERGVALGAERIDSATVLWAAGVAASPAGQWLAAATDRAGRVRVRADLSIETDPAIFVIGDSALVETAGGKRVPGVAPAAKQQGTYVARVLASRVAGKPAPPAFSYRDPGNLATIGRKCAVIEFPFFTLRGWPAWWVWGIAHIYFLVGVPSPLLISIRWFWEYVTYSRGARLITGSEHAD